MDAERFDAFVRSLPVVPRRTALGGVFGAGLAALLGQFPSDDATAKKKRRNKRKRKKKCRGSKKKCGKTCIPNTPCCGGCDTDQVCCDGACAACCTSDDCPPDANCAVGVCVCPMSGDVVCGDICTDLATDGANCGSCGNVCISGGCIHGACTCSGESDCPDECTCGVREQGWAACFGSVMTATECDEDDDCPFGGVCLVNNRCSRPCQA